MGGMIGHCEEIENSSGVTGNCACQAIGDMLPEGGKLVVMSDCVQGIEPCKWKEKGHQFQRLGF